MPRTFTRTRKIGWKHWTSVTGGASALSAGSIAVNLLAAQHEPETILRTRGNLIVYADGTQVPGALVQVGVGMCLVPEGTGTTVTWSPLTDPDAPWFWFEVFHVGYEEMVTDVVDIPGLSIVRKVIDSKAMRKVPQSTEVQLVIEQATAISAMSINVQMSARILSGHA